MLVLSDLFLARSRHGESNDSEVCFSGYYNLPSSLQSEHLRGIAFSSDSAAGPEPRPDSSSATTTYLYQSLSSADLFSVHNGAIQASKQAHTLSLLTQQPLPNPSQTLSSTSAS